MGILNIDDGTILAPGLRFVDDPNTGLYRIGADNIGLALAGVKALDIAANLLTYSAAASTANQVLAITNTSNAAAASHAYADISVGGTTSTGDPHVRLTIPGGTSWYMGVDNSGNDAFWIGTGTAVATNGFLRILNLAGASFFAVLPPALSVLGTQVSDVSVFVVDARTLTITNTAQETGLSATATILATTLNQSGGAVTVDKYAGLTSVGATAGASVTLTHSSAFRALTGGAAVNASGFYAEAQTGGTTGNYQLLMVNGGTEPSAAPADHVGLYAVDIGAAAVLGIASETAVVTPAGDFALTSKLIVRVNGVSYAIGMTTVLT